MFGLKRIESLIKAYETTRPCQNSTWEPARNIREDAPRSIKDFYRDSQNGYKTTQSKGEFIIWVSQEFDRWAELVDLDTGEKVWKYQLHITTEIYFLDAEYSFSRTANLSQTSQMVGNPGLTSQDELRVSFLMGQNS
ncbi:hypothetical protein TWF481_002815 [Arthrobotrys musiformis]|uniref:Uncharacterized protein n=1 Tax=Arthrobotrys musiformis TaxID=47236 RepID=A0AAV9VT16_9PEZI